MGGAGVLLLHGFTGNPASLRPLAEDLAGRGLAVELPRLPGHGTSWLELQRTSARDWAGEAAAGLQRLRRRTRGQVVVVGLSMGAMLALHLAQLAPGAPGAPDVAAHRPGSAGSAGEHAELAGIVLINPWIRSSDRRLPLALALRAVLRSIRGIGNDIARPGADELPYPRVPLRALASQQQLQAQVRAGLQHVHVPILLLTSRTDHVVDADNAGLIRAGISSTDVEQLWLERSYHVATLDHDADLIAARIAAFVERVTA